MATAGELDGRLISDGRAIDVAAPASTLVPKGALTRIDGWTGFALSEILAADTARGLALEVAGDRLWRVKVPSGVAGTRGYYLKWSTGGTYKTGATDLEDETSGTQTATSVAKVEQVRGSDGFATLRCIN